MLEKRKDYHDLRYQIADAQGKKVWIRCFGKIKWNESGTKPLFFAGRMTQQEEGFVVDALTNFPQTQLWKNSSRGFRNLESAVRQLDFHFTISHKSITIMDAAMETA